MIGTKMRIFRKFSKKIDTDFSIPQKPSHFKSIFCLGKKHLNEICFSDESIEVVGLGYRPMGQKKFSTKYFFAKNLQQNPNEIFQKIGQAQFVPNLTIKN